jgi:chain length determinant protein tyrosine kinase EpsG
MGRILVEHGKITPTDAERVLRLQREHGMRFGEAARQLGLITETDVQQVLAEQFGFSYVRPGQGDFPKELIAAHDPFGQGSEMLRMVRSQLLQRWFAGERNELVIASIGAEDGGSMFTANLGIMFAQLGQPTLIIDANMREPKQQEIFRVRSRQGLSEILAGRGGLNAICRSDHFEDLSILPAGTVPPNPQELLYRPIFQVLREHLRRHFSIILYDVPALSSSGDALAVASGIGGTLLVARRDATQLADLNIVRDKMKRCGVELVGSVLVN